MNIPAPAAPQPQPTPPWWFFEAKAFWKGHGTKVIGGLVTVVGLIAAANPQVVAMLGKFVGTDRAAGIVVVAGGAWTILRGFNNTKQNQQGS